MENPLDKISILANDFRTLHMTIINIEFYLRISYINHCYINHVKR